MNLLADLYPAALRRQHPYGNLQPFPGLVDDRHRAISPLRLTKDLKADTVERVERIEDLNLSVFRAQGIVGVGVSTRMSTVSSPPEDSPPTTSAGSTPIPASCCPFRCSAASFATSSSSR